MKKDYIVLKGADATYTNSRLQWNIAPHYFPNLAQDGHEDMYMKLLAIDFTAQGTADSITHSAVIDTNLKFQNQTSTVASAIGIVGMELKQDTGLDWFVSPTSQLTSMPLKVSKFNSIQIWLKYQNEYLDVTASGLQSWFTAIIEIEYRDNNIKELL